MKSPRTRRNPSHVSWRPAAHRVLRCAGVCIMAAAVLAPSTTLAAMPDHSKMSVKILASTGPAKISAPKHACRGTKGVFNFALRVTGIALRTDPRTTREPLKRRGYVFVYLDKIPAAAYKRWNLSRVPPGFLYYGGATKFPICLTLPIVRRKGRHALWVSLGQTTGALYKSVKAVRFEITIT
jgi:hypothetical protein